jgi:hypothetical protein
MKIDVNRSLEKGKKRFTDPSNYSLSLVELFSLDTDSSLFRDIYDIKMCAFSIVKRTF